jgi:U3 small nucleolar RNA-associated protein 18
MSRVRDANHQSTSHSILSSLDWNPRHPNMLLTAGLDKTLRLFHIDGRDNEVVHQVHFKSMPIYCAQFSRDGRCVIASGRRPHFFSVDLAEAAMVEVRSTLGLLIDDLF